MAADPQAKVFQAQRDVNAAVAELRQAERARETSSQDAVGRNQAVLQSMEDLRIAQQEAESAIKFDQQQRQLKQQEQQQKAKQQGAQKAASGPSPVEQATQGLEQKINPGNPTAGVGSANPAQLLAQAGPGGAQGGQLAQQTLSQLQGGASATPAGPGGQPTSVQIAGQNFPVPGQIQTQRQTGQEGGSRADVVAGVPRNTFETSTRPNVLGADQAASLLLRQQNASDLLSQEERRTNAFVFRQIVEQFGGDPASAAAVLEAWQAGGMGTVSQILQQPGIKTTKQLELGIQRSIARAQIAKFKSDIPGRSLATALGLAPEGHAEVKLATAVERHQAALKSEDFAQQTDSIASLYLQAGYVMLPKASGFFGQFFQDDVQATIIPGNPFIRMLAMEEAADADNRTPEEQRNLERLVSLPVFDRDGKGYKIAGGVSSGVTTMLENIVIRIHRGGGPIQGGPETALPKESRDSDDPAVQLDAAVEAKQKATPGRSLELGTFGKLLKGAPGKVREGVGRRVRQAGEGGTPVGIPAPPGSPRARRRARDDLSLEAIEQRFGPGSR